ncbi:two-component system sensor histidine kinase MtrB [Allonocardiopsis opalescens]|uniref:histidine kinase n=1 Tax=Allonocardiopsis opalescens TaxID=1144618 RepID=A0A2T0PWU9_9ACTN|nr:two-component system sensor histidine kinase MtrB [Allonocardiopsis opalescens]
MLRSLRSRLIITFTLVALTSTVLVSVFTYALVRNQLLEPAQDAALNHVREVLAYQASPELLRTPDGPPDDTLEDLAQELRAGSNGSVLMTFEDEVRVMDRFGPADVPPELAALAETDIGFQRVQQPDGPWVVIGTRVHVPSAASQTGMPSPLRVYVFISLNEQQQELDRLEQTFTRTGAAAVGCALVIGAVLAASVLKPVRRFRDAARRLGLGHLDTRVEVRGGDELADLAHTFNESAVALQRAVEELRRMEANARRFAADVSHELRTPLTAMTAVSDVLEEESERLPPDTQTAARLVASETRRLHRLVEDLLEISRLDAGVSALSPDDVAVGEALRECLRARGWTDRVDIDAPAELRARVDPRRFDVIVANLVGNALRHGAPPVTVTARAAEDADLEITVRDHGPGIPSGMLTDVFERFVKADSSRGGAGGSGLGLAIALANASLHGGGIEARNDGGAVFTVRLPAGPADPS